jgi:preprotein translocase subunit SecF
MEFFRFSRDIPFMRHALVFNVISALTFLAAVFFLATRGLHFSIEFTGGIVMQTTYAQTADVEKIRTSREAELRRSAGAELRQLARRADPLPARQGREAEPSRRRRVRRAVQGRERQRHAAERPATRARRRRGRCARPAARSR